MTFKLSQNEKFSIVAVHNIYTDLKDEHAQLSDGTWVLQKIPFEIEKTWQKWLGSLKVDQLAKANLVLIRTTLSGDPKIFDGEHEALGRHVNQLFHMLQLGGVPEYESADTLKGSFYDGNTEIRQHGAMERFFPCKGYSRLPVTLDRLEEAIKLRDALEVIYPGNGNPAFARLGRGLNILMKSLKDRNGQEKLHQAVRSLEALILPEIGTTKKQFVHRCQTFAKANQYAVDTLGEIFDMRSDSEHVHEWSRSLEKYDAAKRDDIAWHRTRQIEALARFAYSRIMLYQDVRNHFQNEIVLESFWKTFDDGARRAQWGAALDLSSIPIAEEYLGSGAANT